MEWVLFRRNEFLHGGEGGMTEKVCLLGLVRLNSLVNGAYSTPNLLGLMGWADITEWRWFLSNNHTTLFSRSWKIWLGTISIVIQSYPWCWMSFMKRKSNRHWPMQNPQSRGRGWILSPLQLPPKAANAGERKPVQYSVLHAQSSELVHKDTMVICIKGC